MLAEMNRLAEQLTAILTAECECGNLICFQQLEEYREHDVRVMRALEGLYAEQFGYAAADETDEVCFSCTQTYTSPSAGHPSSNSYAALLLIRSTQPPLCINNIIETQRHALKKLEIQK